MKEIDLHRYRRAHRWRVGETGEYLDVDKPPFLIVRSPGATVMVNAESPAETRELYRDLKSAFEKAHRDAVSALPPEQP